MSGIDEAVDHAITAHYVGESSRVAAFHRALRERGYVVISEAEYLRLSCRVVGSPTHAEI